MSTFDNALLAAIGKAGDSNDISLIVRRCWHADLPDLDLRIWEGQGALNTNDGNEWLGTIDGRGRNHLQVPRIADGRDGSSPEYSFTFPELDAATYAALKADQTAVKGRALRCYLALIALGEGLRPATPLSFFAELEMQSTRFEEALTLDGLSFRRRYTFTVVAKDGNAGRSQIPGRTYSDAAQKERASQLGVTPDRGCEFLALLANRTYRVP